MAITIKNPPRGGISTKRVEKYSLAEKLEALKVYELCGYNAGEAARKTGYPKSNILYWRNTLKPELQKNTVMNEEVRLIQKKASKLTEFVQDQAVETISNAVARANKLVAKETNLDKLSNYLKAVTPLLQAVTDNLSPDSAHKGTLSLSKKLKSLEELIEDVDHESI